LTRSRTYPPAFVVGPGRE